MTPTASGKRASVEETASARCAATCSPLQDSSLRLANLGYSKDWKGQGVRYIQTATLINTENSASTFGKEQMVQVEVLESKLLHFACQNL